MNLLDIYNTHAKGEITDEDAAQLFGLTVRDFRFKKSRLGLRLPTILAALDKIRRDEITRDQAAEACGVKAREINNYMTVWRVRRPVKEYLVRQTLAQIKWEIRKRYAIEVIRGYTSFEDAAEAADCDERQMRRWVEKLLNKHFGLKTIKDIKPLSSSKRVRMGDEIEEAEGLELVKLSVLNAISRGDKTIGEEAADRIALEAARKVRRHVRRNSTKALEAQGG